MEIRSASFICWPLTFIAVFAFTNFLSAMRRWLHVETAVALFLMMDMIHLLSSSDSGTRPLTAAGGPELPPYLRLCSGGRTDETGRANLEDCLEGGISRGWGP